jgi:excisionase family DNA binding protein
MRGVTADRERSLGAYMNSTTEDRWLSVDEIAVYLGIKRDTVYKWIDRKHMPAHKVGSLWKFKKEEIDDWVRSGDASDRRAGHGDD